MSLVSGKFSNETIKLEDSSPDGTSRINVQFENGQLSKVDPPSTMVFIGGG